MAWDSLITIDPEGPPWGVTRKEWNYANSKRHFGKVFIVIGIACLIMALISFVMYFQDQSIKTVSLSKIVDQKTDYTGKVAISAELKTDKSRQLPGTNKNVIYGNISIDVDEILNKTYRPKEDYGKKGFIPHKGISENLFHWEFLADSFYLKDGNARLELNLDKTQLPITNDYRADDDLITHYNDRPKSFKRSISVEYAKKVYPLTLDKWQDKRRLINIKREYLEDQQTATLIVQLDQGKIKKIESLQPGTLSDIKRGHKNGILALIISGLVFIILGAFLYRNGKRHREALIKFSDKD